MILNDSMLSVAFRYRETELWKVLTDSDIFAVRLSTGEIGYCCVMGNAGEHNALGLYVGDVGFSTFLKTIMMANSDITAVHEIVMTFDCINCDFTNADGIMPQSKEIIKAYTKLHGLKIRRPQGWPDFVRHSPHKMPWAITNEKDAQAITEALSASLEVARMLEEQGLEELGFDTNGEYPTLEGGKNVPYLIPQSDGTYEWSLVKLPALRQDVYPMPIFDNDILIHKMKGLKKSDTLQCRLIHIPSPISSDTSEVPFFPAVLLCLDEGSEFLFPVPGMANFESEPEKMLNDLADMLCSSQLCPTKIAVTDELTQKMLDDFCSKCAIVLEKKSSLPELDDACSSLLSQFME